MTVTGIRKVALVTGAGSGIGRACALRLAEHGYSVVLAGRRRAALEAVVEAAHALGGEALAVPCDVTDADGVAGLFDTIRERAMAALDVLFNNAGRNGSPVDIDELAIDEWRSVVDIESDRRVLCTRAGVRLMKTQNPRGGRIVNNGSISAHAPRPN